MGQSGALDPPGTLGPERRAGPTAMFTAWPARHPLQVCEHIGAEVMQAQALMATVLDFELMEQVGCCLCHPTATSSVQLPA